MLSFSIPMPIRTGTIFGSPPSSPQIPTVFPLAANA